MEFHSLHIRSTYFCIFICLILILSVTLSIDLSWQHIMACQKTHYQSASSGRFEAEPRAPMESVDKNRNYQLVKQSHCIYFCLPFLLTLPSSSLWSRKKTGHSLSSTCYSGEEEMAAWMSLSTGSPRIQTGISTLSPIIRPT